MEDFNKSYYFSTPIYMVQKPEWVEKVDKACEKYIIKAKNHYQKIITKRDNLLGKKIGDHGLSYNSGSIVNDPELSELQAYIGLHSWIFLQEMGYDLTHQDMYWTEFWVQQFGSKGGGHHEGHIHSNNHVSGFYFLRCSEKTSFPMFLEPRYIKEMTQLPLAKKLNADAPAIDKVKYSPKPGTLIFFPAYLEHQYVVDNGVEDFRFIHFNLQCIRKSIVDTIKHVAISSINQKK
jgi:uncharacterized protein (TIGR02466 family)